MCVIRVLVAEDHPVAREGIRDILRREEDIHVIGEADSGDSAVALCETLHPDLVLMDIGMPGLNGLEATRTIRSRFPSVKVLVLTAYDEQALVVEFLKMGASGFILKTQGAAEIVAAIRGAYHGDTVIAPSAGRALADLVSGIGTGTERENEKKDHAPSALTTRERQVLQLSAEGLTAKEIAGKMDISERTVHTHFRNIFAKLDAVSRTDAVVRAAKNGWIRLP